MLRPLGHNMPPVEGKLRTRAATAFVHLLAVSLALASAPAFACGKWGPRDFAMAERGLRKAKAKADLVVIGIWTFAPDTSAEQASGFGTITVKGKGGTPDRTIRAWSEQIFYPNCTNLLRTPQRAIDGEHAVVGRFYLRRDPNNGQIAIIHFEPIKGQR